jgi:peptidoglycan/xylan/chitin deacetylase (PgdA/CDA1 family)
MDRTTSFLGRFYEAAQRRHPDVLFHGDCSRPEIALTFDDGPHPYDTSRLLNVLEKHRVRATFHLLGKSVKRHPDLVRRIYGCGHQTALHGYRHIPFPLESPASLRDGLRRTQEIIAGAAGIPFSSIRDLRPPYGVFTARTRSLLRDWEYRLVMWSCMPPHWMQPVGWSIRQVTEALVPGALIVLHDGHGHGRRVAEIVEDIIPRARSLGLDFVTVDEMQSNRSSGSASS